MKLSHSGLLLGVVLSAVSYPAFALVADDECIIDEEMRSVRVAMDEMSYGVYKEQVQAELDKAVDAAPSVKDASCLPVLDDMDGLIRARLPSMSNIGGGILSKMKDMACNMANGYLTSLSRRAQFNISDPLGIASVGVGATTGTGGTQVETYDFGKVAEDVATRTAKDTIRGGISESNKQINNLPSGPSNRTPRVDQEFGDGVRDAIKGL